MQIRSRRQFIKTAARALCATGTALEALPSFAQSPGERPPRSTGAAVLGPLGRVPVAWIIDDSTCLVNLNRFSMPQFDETYGGANPVYKRPWREWPSEIPDAFVRKFGEWSAENGVKGKYSIVPYPSCVGRLDRFLPGWTKRELADSIDLVRTVMMPNWDIHPEMVTHTRVIDVRTGQPYPDSSTKFMENWDWTTGRSVEEITEYLRYALTILKNIGLNCEGITTPGGFGNRARPQLAQATLQSVRDVFGAEIPHYFRDLYDSGPESIAPRVEYASDLGTPDPRCVVSIVGCTGDWTGGWDCTPPGGVDRFITEDLQRGRMVDVIQRGGPAIAVSHWTGIYWNGQELGFKIMKEVVQRLQQRFSNLIWMKLSAIARYWAAKELTRIEPTAPRVDFHAPFACPDFTVQLETTQTGAPEIHHGNEVLALRQVRNASELTSRSWCYDGKSLIVCFDLPKGASALARHA